MDALAERVLNKATNDVNISKNRTFYQRPMMNGLIRKGFDAEHAFIDSFEFMWEHIGRMFVQGLEGTQDDV